MIHTIKKGYFHDVILNTETDMHNFSEEIAIVFPSLNPDENMVNYVKNW